MNDRSSRFAEWRTPDSLVQQIRECTPSGEIFLDPCTDAANPVGAHYFMWREGLTRDWEVRDISQGLVYVNYPGGRGNAAKWYNKTHESCVGIRPYCFMLFNLGALRTLNPTYVRKCTLVVPTKRICFEYPTFGGEDARDNFDPREAWKYSWVPGTSPTRDNGLLFYGCADCDIRAAFPDAIVIGGE